MKKEKAKLWIIQHRGIIGTAIILLILVILSILIKISYKYYSSISETAKMIVGTLLGALFGGCLTLVGSIYVNRSSQKAQNAIRRKNEIYKPLYEELMIIHHDILLKNPYPNLFGFDKAKQTELKYPQYVEWGKIKMDSRYFEVPTDLRKAMEVLYQKISQYRKCLPDVYQSINRIYCEERKKLDGANIPNQQNIGWSIYKCILTGKQPDNNTLFWGVVKVDEDVANLFWENLKIRCNEDDYIMKCVDAKISWNNAEKEVLDLLGMYIQYITLKYEQ